MFNVEKVKEMLGDIVKSSFEWAQEQREDERYIKLERVFATIPLPGIDVPFHSHYLWAGFIPFRACKLLAEFLDASVLTDFQIFQKGLTPHSSTPIC
jgi:hypothetical protein